MHSRSHRSSSIRRSSSPFPANDPLGVLESTASVIQQATFVTIDQGAIARLADDLMAMRAVPPAWDSTLHFRDLTPTGAPKTAGWMLVLDALNFCFWAQGWVQGDDPDFRWRVEWQGTTHDGYAALAAALSRAVEEGIPVWDADWLMQLTANELHHVLRPVAGCPEIPLFDARLAHLHELGTGLHAIRTEHLDSDPVAHLIQHARGSAVELVREVVARFPSFDDVSSVDRR
ncbi:MAG: queuosine salvage family protein [Thermomicrobiales bacterium]